MACDLENEFFENFNHIISNIENEPNVPNHNLRLFDHICEYKSFLFSNYDKYGDFLQLTKLILIKFIKNGIDTIDMVHFLSILFDIYPSAQRIQGTSDDYIEYIQIDNEKIYI